MITTQLSLFGADMMDANKNLNQNFLDILQAASGEGTGTNAIPNIPVTAPTKTAPAQQNQIQDRGCTRIIIDNKTVIYHCGDKTFLKRFGRDGGLFLRLTDGKKVILTD